MSIFQKIIDRQVPASIVYEDENVLAFKDLHPQAKIHLLFIHKVASKDIVEMSEKYPQQFQQIYRAISVYTREAKLTETGFRVVSNVGADAGQTVFHTHFHLLAGESLGRFGK